MTSIARELIAYVGELTVTSGDHAGELWDVLPWQRRFLRGAFGTPGPAALSIGRKNGKSAVVASVACAVADPDGPLHGPRREAVCVASSFAQARIIFEDVLAMLRVRTGGLPARDWRVQDSANSAMVEHRASGARVRCVGSDPRRAHGLRPYIALLDEPAQWERTKSDRMYAAIRSAMAQGGKLIALGTRSSNPAHWFSRLLRGDDGYAQLHACEPDVPLTVKALRKANPSYDHLPGLRALIAEELREARRDPAALIRVRALHANAGVDEVATMHLVDATAWAKSEDATAEPDGMCSWGVDLGENVSMSAIAAYWPRSGLIRAVAAFPRQPSLAERGLRDGVGADYQLMAERGELLRLGEHTVDVAELLRVALRRFGPPAALTCDAWRAADLREALHDTRFPPAQLVTRRNGPKDGSEDARAFARAVLDGDVRHEGSLLIDASLREAVLQTDTAGNAWLTKRRANVSRDDVAAACMLAVSTGTSGPERTRSQRTG